MNVILELGPNYRKLEAALRKAPKDTYKAIVSGLQTGIGEAANVVKLEVMQGHVRSGALQRAIASYGDDRDKLVGYIGVGDKTNVAPYAWLLGQDIKTITPKRSQFLSIPIADGLKPSGEARYSSPRQVPDGFFFRKNNNLFFGQRTGKSFRLLFVLKPSVTVSGFNIFPHVIEQQIPRMVQAIKKSLSDMFRKIGIR